MYTTYDYKTKKELKEAVSRGDRVTVYQPGPFPEYGERRDGTVTLEGPHYPASHTWYAQATLRDGCIVKVK